MVDVGGDALTDGTDPGLRSPLADQLALAAAARTGLPVDLLIAAPGLDGELPRNVVPRRLTAIGAHQLADLNAHDLAGSRGVFAWHPSEASGLLAAAVYGHRGTVEVRDAGDQVLLDQHTCELYRVSEFAVPAWSPATELAQTRSLDEAERVIHRRTGLSEIAYETGKTGQLAARVARAPTMELLPEIDAHAARAAALGADYLSTRRLSELVGASTLPAFEQLKRLLAAHRPDQHRPTLYRTCRPRV